MPSLRGRIVKIAGEPVVQSKVPSDARWAVDSDRGVTYSATPPEGSRLVAGEWWAPDYRGPQLVSFDAELARAFGIGVGDTITINVLGRDIEAKIASCGGSNGSRCRSTSSSSSPPGLLDKAPHTFLATVKGDAGGRGEGSSRTSPTASPTLPCVRIRDAIQTTSEILGNIGLAVRLIGLLSILAGILVLAGAMLATQRRRIHEAVIMKVLGATRARIAGTFAWEFATLGLAMALASLAVGTAAAYLVVHNLMNLSWTFADGRRGGGSRRNGPDPGLRAG